MFDNLKSEMNNVKRFKQILGVFFEQGFGYLIDQTPLKDYVPFHKRVKKTLIAEKELSFPVRMRLAFERLGPTFIKLGQILSLRPDLVPQEYITEFEKMLDHVPTFPLAEAKKIIEQEFQKPVSALFKDFNETPIASGSLAQVYKAKLKTNAVVAVKVQRPNVDSLMKSDIEIMLYVAEILDEHFRRYDFHLETIVQEFARWTEQELNFYIEAVHAERFRENFKGSKLVYVPKVYEEYTTKKILTTEFINGIEINQIQKIKASKIDIMRFVRNGYQAMITQVFDHGYFHADPHPGNLFVMKDGRIAMVDFGIVGEFDRKLKSKALNLFVAVIKNDVDAIAKNIIALDPAHKDIDLEKFKRSLSDAIAPIQVGALRRVKVSQVLMDVLNLALHYKIKIPVDFILYGKTTLTVEGLALKYNANFQTKQESIKLITALLKKRYQPSRILDGLKGFAYDALALEENIPEYTHDLLEKLKSNKLNVDIENQDVNSFVDEMEKLSGNLSFGIIIGALVIGSSLIFTLDKFRYISFVGYFLSAILAIWLIKRTVFVKRNI